MIVPLFWKNIFINYMQVFMCVMFGTAAMLLLPQIKDLVKFVHTCPQKWHVLLFAFAQLLHLTPAALPIVGLISSAILANTMSRNQEIISLNASGARFSTIITPILLISAFMSLLNSVLVSDIAPGCRRVAREFAKKIILSDAYLLVNSTGKALIGDMTPIMHLKDRGGIYFLMDNGLPAILTVGNSTSDGSVWTSNNIGLISAKPTPEDAYDWFRIENRDLIEVNIPPLVQFIDSSQEEQSIKELPMKILIHEAKYARSKYHPYAELFRRLIFSLLPFPMGWSGFAMGIHNRRSGIQLRKILLMVPIPLLVLSCAISARPPMPLPIMLFLYTVPTAGQFVVTCISQMKFATGHGWVL